ncbi:MAG: transcriptional regulator [Myxococcota bacterium]|nr:transcriptional regulator [Myxococcota bacterium]
MRDVKRIEIVVEAAQQARIERLIEEAGIDGFTLLHTVAGRGQRGAREGDGLSDAFQNVYFVIAAPAERMEAFVESVRPVLKRVGGICLVSDARWLKH